MTGGKLGAAVAANPMTWKDWLSATATVATLCALLVMGGRILEQLERARADVAHLSSEVVKLRVDLAHQQLQITQQAGADRLHDEQINTIRREIDTLARRPAR